MLESIKGYAQLKHLWRTQGRRCPIYHLFITDETGWQLCHIVRKVNGELDNPLNLVMLHQEFHHIAPRSRDFSIVKQPLELSKGLSRMPGN